VLLQPLGWRAAEQIDGRCQRVAGLDLDAGVSVRLPEQGTGRRL